MEKSIPSIVARYRGNKSLRGFAAELCSNMPKSISYQTIKNWEDSTTRPLYYEMWAIALENNDWRRDMALEILSILKPNIRPDI